MSKIIKNYVQMQKTDQESLKNVEKILKNRRKIVKKFIKKG